MKTPSRVMQALIVLVLLLYFGLAMFGKSIWASFDVSEAFAQTLINLTIAAVMYYIGTTSSSQKKDDTIADQAKAAGPAPASPPPP